MLEARVWNGLACFRFGDSARLADELSMLVLADLKTATCWSAEDGPITDVGRRMVVLDSAGHALAVVETTELTQRRFDAVDVSFAREEGEGDLSLAFWRQAHREYFTARGQFAEDMLLWCERFRVVERIAEPREANAVSALQAVRADDWALWRALRLATLSDSPSAFTSRLADWLYADAARWRARLDAGHNVFALLDGSPVGMVSGMPDQRGGASLIGLWVAPHARGRGLASQLIEAVRAWAAATGANELALSVTDGNDGALRLYRRHGFVLAGRDGNQLHMLRALS